MRIGLVGCGRWGRLILRDLVALEAEVSVAVPSPASQAKATELGAASTHSRVEDLPPSDGYVVAVPTIHHARIIKALLPAGKPIFVEKPLTCDEDDALDILEQAPDRVFCMDKWRYHGGVLKLAELARSGALGTVKSVRCWRLGWGNPHNDVDAVWILAPHDLSIAYEILGYLPQVQWASGVDGGTFGTSLIGHLQDSPNSPSVVLEVSSSHPVARRSVVVVGSEGSAQFGGSYDNIVLLNRPGQEAEEIAISTDMPLLAELRAFLDHLRGGVPPKSSAAEASLIVSRIAAMRRAAGFS